MIATDIQMPAMLPKRVRRGPAAVLGWVIDTLDDNVRPRRNAEAVLRDVMAKLARLADIDASVPSPSLTPTAVGVDQALPATGTSLRYSSPMQTNVSAIHTPGEDGSSADLADLKRLEDICWDEIYRMKRTGKTWGMHQLVDQARRLKLDQIRVKERGDVPADCIPRGEVDEMKRRIAQALQPFPEATKAVMEALAE